MPALPAARPRRPVGEGIRSGLSRIPSPSPCSPGVARDRECPHAVVLQTNVKRSYVHLFQVTGQKLNLNNVLQLVLTPIFKSLRFLMHRFGYESKFGPNLAPFQPRDKLEMKLFRADWGIRWK